MVTGVKALRSFFRYAGERGGCAPGLAVGIEGPRLFSHESLPVGPKWEEVQRLIASTDTDCRQDIRDRAILLLLAVYGLRRGEIVALTLDDVDWAQDILHVSRPKQRCKQDYPLAAEVGEAILRYLQWVRPRIQARSLFLTLRAPFRPLVATSLHYLVSTRLKVLNITCTQSGPHALRHACASARLWSVTRTRPKSIRPRSQPSVSVHTASDTRRQLICFVPASTSIRCGHGLVTSASTPPMSTPKSIWRQRPRLWRNAMSPRATKQRGGGLTIPS